MASSNRQINVRNIKHAKKVFNEYLQNAARPEHFLSVDDETAPLRRMDCGILTSTRRSFIGLRMRWSDENGRWKMIDGSTIVAEDEMFRFLAMILSTTDIRCPIKLWEKLQEKAEGLLRQDVRIMSQIWNEYGLDDLVVQEADGEEDGETYSLLNSLINR